MRHHKLTELHPRFSLAPVRRRRSALDYLVDGMLDGLYVLGLTAAAVLVIAGVACGLRWIGT